MKIIVPPIKSQGIKTKLIPWINDTLQHHLSTWIEPFMGTGVVAFNVKPQKAILCDSNPHIICFYNAIKQDKINPNIVRCFLEEEGEKLSTKEDYYYEVRERFNNQHNPLDFLFINRACFNGMIRFNKKGYHNVPFCKKKDRFSKSYITKIVNQVEAVSKIIKRSDYTFKQQDFSETILSATQEDTIYCDPPYIDRYVDYYNGWSSEDEMRLYELLDKFEGKFILSTWHSNRYRSNKYLKTIWEKFNILTKTHFYHLGASEKNRNSMLEALVLNFSPPKIKSKKILETKSLFEELNKSASLQMSAS